MTSRSYLHKLLLLGLFFTHSIFAQNLNTWPNKPVKIIVPYGAAGSSDTLARIIADQLSKVFKQTFIVENKPGAGGTIASEMVAKSAPDGYTLVISGIGSHVIAPFQYANKYDPVKDFTHIAFLGGPPLALVVNPNLPITDLKSFVNYAKSQANGMVYGSPGIGTHGNIIGEYFAEINNISLVHVGYKGGGTVVNDIAGGQLPAGFMTLTSAKSLVMGNKLRLISVSSAKRITNFPKTPTFEELGYPKLTSTTWFSVSGPAGMPSNIVEKLNMAINQSMQTPQAREKLEFEDMEFTPMTPPEFNKFFQNEISTWGPIAVKVLPK
ncbi:Tripartite-type tricarboxylate transporter, receptor component TctC [Polynucleobacter kasalickyi]|uniref:Tripartite-type tricarboxylate transporter, receptor component TctC n=1 Tax=Polynucleobacter kasalickyi TaxID=1938817 RepID=A0A1W1YBK3_9BURK|nr:Tripartite-type tricarboxylate transporter, receptor component TctC [Polynucleobacter kasalickyi]